MPYRKSPSSGQACLVPVNPYLTRRFSTARAPKPRKTGAKSVAWNIQLDGRRDKPASGIRAACGRVVASDLDIDARLSADPTLIGRRKFQGLTTSLRRSNGLRRLPGRHWRRQRGVGNATLPPRLAILAYVGQYPAVAPLSIEFQGADR